MKNLKTLSRISVIFCTIILLSSSAFAQTAGIIIQPEFNTSNTRRGLFIESPVYKSIGIYSDFKVLKNVHNEKQYNYRQWNAGLSVRVSKSVSTIFSASVLNQLATDRKSPMQKIIRGDYIDQNRAYQAGFVYKAEYLSVLGGYEFDKNFGNARITIGLGFNLGFNY